MVRCIVRIDGDTDAGADVDVLPLPLEVERAGQRGDDFCGNRRYVFAAADVGQNHCEFVATDAGDGVRFAHLLAYRFGHFAQ